MLIPKTSLNFRVIEFAGVAITRERKALADAIVKD